jgi:UDP-N-acetylenolpyruvoylglucosamine reductase
METQEVHNWFGNITSFPQVVIEPRNVQELITVMRDATAYPSPVRAVASKHPTAACGMADNGTLVVMRQMNRILDIGPDTVTAEAGALYIDVAKVLRRRNLQFFVNPEIGSLSMGSAACCGTNDASIPGEFGQVCSYAIAMKMVTPSGQVVEVTEEQPEFLQAMRSSYGLFGIVYEVTFRVKPLRSMAVRPWTHRLAAFERELQALKGLGGSVMMYINLFINKITVEFRRNRDDQAPRQASSWQWRLHNYAYGRLGPHASHLATRCIPLKGLRSHSTAL